jgi:hypothetical protein
MGTVPGLTTVEVDRSVKVRRDSRKRSQPKEKSAEREVSRFWQTSATFLLLLERVRCNSEYIRKTEFFGSSPPHSVTRSAATAMTRDP